MKIAILGGSFNPIHLGHLFLADAVLASGYGRVIFVPAFQSPFKAGAKGPSPSDRLDMLCASIAGDHRLTVDDCEIRRAGVSYTVDTIADIKQRYLPEGKPGLILGDDLADTFYQWKDAASIANETDIIIARRLSKTQNAVSAEAFPFPHHELENEIMDISSRQVREKIQNGENWRSLVPEGARFIIEDRQLYGYETVHENTAEKSASFSLETIAFFENLARRTLSPSRFLHSRNTALLARDLCLQYNLDPNAGYFAGITHDLCKSMDDEEIMFLAKSDGLEISKLEMGKPSLLHGRAAAVLLQTQYDIKDKAVIEAVQNHVTGGTGTGPLAKIIYIADKLEVSRYWIDTALRSLKENAGLDDFFKAVLDYTVSHINSRYMKISGETKKLLSAMEDKSSSGLQEEKT
ncbi:MAG: nicotinate (nicotinamide) nucleotide adenylyltransferase [Treponema sp.]|jgi:nicotinate-nucleotide adenylyltransferase|nr:nicotinate (nicotinamide) nucleotide adenylyltransferase [Treponema sp.]